MAGIHTKHKVPKPELTHVSAEFMQDGNTLGTTSEVEDIAVSLEFQEGESDGCFVMIKSETGWSFDDMSELAALVDRVRKIL